MYLINYYENRLNTRHPYCIICRPEMAKNTTTVFPPAAEETRRSRTESISRNRKKNTWNKFEIQYYNIDYIFIWTIILFYIYLWPCIECNQIRDSIKLLKFCTVTATTYYIFMFKIILVDYYLAWECIRFRMRKHNDQRKSLFYVYFILIIILDIT